MRLHLWLAGVPLLFACSESTPISSPPPAPSSADAGFADAASTTDAGEEAPQNPLPDKPLRFGTARVTFRTGPWRMSATTESPGADRRSFTYQRGELIAPPAGEEDERGYLWEEVNLDNEGRLPPNTFGGDEVVGMVYAATTLTNTEPLRLVARLDAIDLRVNGYSRPGDPYAHGEARHPIVLAPGTHEFLARGLSRRRHRIQLWQTDNEVWLNTNDVTRPDILRDESQTLYLGLPLLNLTGTDLTDLQARVLDSDYFEGTERAIRPLPADGMTQVGFQLEVKGPIPAQVDTATVTLVVTGPSLEANYIIQYGLDVVDGTAAYRRTFISDMDESVQTYAIRPPTEVVAGRQYAMALSLHGAGVRALGQARAYGPKDWAYVVAATNRRRFGFDWQDWGRLDALEVRAQALTHLPIDPLQVHVTGHSMGGHGTWHVGVMHPDLFAVIGPSAGWESFASYGGENPTRGAFVQARAHNDTLNYKQNYAARSVYIIHGENDNNVPLQQAETMFAELQGIPRDLFLHVEPGRGHWWDGYPEPGAACVDWPPLFDLMQERRRTPYELSFDFLSPSPWVSDTRSYVQILAAADPLANVQARSEVNGGAVELVTTNVAAMELNTEALRAEGVTSLTIDGEPADLSPPTLTVGGAVKQPGLHGPIKEALFKPFCFVYPDDAAPGSVLREVATYLMATWSIIGNGSACAVPFSARDTLGNTNRVYIGIPSASLDIPAAMRMTWTAEAIEVGGATISEGSLQVVFPEEDRLAVSLYATDGEAFVLRYFAPFSSRAAFPDFTTLIVRPNGVLGGPAGFFDKDWQYNEDFAP